MTFTIAIDCMGGDFGPVVTVAAAFAFVKKHADARLILVGQEDKIRPLLRTNSASENDRIRVQHASEIVLMDEAPALSLRNKKDSSLRVALNLVKSGEAAGCISAGNTGALMATSRFVLKTMVGVDIDRPAICGVMPTINGRTYMLDLGANVDCTPEQLLQFGIMGATLVSAVEHTENPSVGLLNIGEEAIKGNEVVKRAAELLKESGLNFIGNVEGDGIYKGVADVIVCDGFVGNVALKTSEGLVKMIGHFLREEFNRNILTKLIGAIAKPLVMDHFKKRVDPRRYNGACLLGLRGLVVKSHGSADEFGFFCALERTAEIARNKVIENIQKRIDLSLSQTRLTKEAV